MTAPAATAAAVDIAVEAGDWPPETTLRALVLEALEATATRIAGFPVEAELSVVFTDDAHIAALNGTWRGKPKPTNVLSFPAARPAGNGAGLLGDLVLAGETVAREAAAAHLTLGDHISHLLVHGLLHLVGYDHESDAEAMAMETVEVEILASLGIANPYAEAAPDRAEAVGGNGQ